MQTVMLCFHHYQLCLPCEKPQTDIASPLQENTFEINQPGGSPGHNHHYILLPSHALTTTMPGTFMLLAELAMRCR